MKNYSVKENHVGIVVSEILKYRQTHFESWTSCYFFYKHWKFTCPRFTISANFSLLFEHSTLASSFVRPGPKYNISFKFIFQYYMGLTTITPLPHKLLVKSCNGNPSLLYFKNLKPKPINIFLLYCTRFSCTLMNWYLQLANITIPPYPLPFYWTNKLTNKWGSY